MKNNIPPPQIPEYAQQKMITYYPSTLMCLLACQSTMLLKRSLGSVQPNPTDISTVMVCARSSTSDTCRIRSRSSTPTGPPCVKSRFCLLLRKALLLRLLLSPAIISLYQCAWILTSDAYFTI